MQFYVLYLIWKYPTLTFLTLLLMRKKLTGAWSKVGASKNLLSTVPKSENYAIEQCQRLASQRNTVCFEIAFVNFFTFGWKDLFGVLRNLWNTDSADKFLFLKRKIIVKTLIVLGLKYSKKFKKHTQSYTCFPIFEHFGC